MEDEVNDGDYREMRRRGKKEEEKSRKGKGQDNKREGREERKGEEG
jgi:hypothetical protein